jgi:hypothetical protein
VRPLRLLALLLALGSARADPEGGVEFHGSLQLRVQANRNLPGGAVRLDPATGALDLPDYLATTGRESFGAALASVGLEGRHLSGDLRWVLTADTGELRNERFHRVSEVCWSDRTPSGLARPGSGQCGLYKLAPLVWARVILPVEETALEDQAQVTSNGRPFQDEVRHTLLLREAYATLRFGRAGFAALSAGRRRTVVADGYVHDDYSTGVSLDLDLGAIGPRLDVSAAVFQPTRDLPEHGQDVSPMVVLQIDYLPSLFERAGIFAAALRDRSDGLANVFRGAVEEHLVQVATSNAPGTLLHHRASQLLAATASAALHDQGTLGWLGTSGRLSPWKGQRLSWTAALMGGRIDQVTVDGGSLQVLATDLELRASMASLRWELELPHGAGLGASFLYLSGGDLPRAHLDGLGRIEPAKGSYRGFLGVSPYLTETHLFFGGGLSQSYADRQAHAAGVNGRGVLAPVLSLSWDATEQLTLHGRGAWLRAESPGPFGGLGYGTEANLDLSFEATSWLVVGLEADVLFPGDFFRGGAPITRGILALDVATP